MYALPMNAKADNKYLGIFVLLTSVAVCLLVDPVNSIDPVNLPKLCLLVILSFITTGLTFSKFEYFKLKKNRMALSIIGLFVLQLVIVLLLDSRDFSAKFYGTYGRNTGFIAYLSLTFILVACMVSASELLIRRYLLAIIGCGSILSFYGIAQSKGYDFYQFELGIGTRTFGSFGNSNFQSAFMGIVAAASLTLLIFSRINVFSKLVLLLLTVFSIYNIALSSQQGYFNFTAGILSAVLIFLFRLTKLIFAWIALTFSIVGTYMVFLGVFNSGPLASIIYKSSLQARDFYWTAAVEMMHRQPLFGVGMDGYGEFYLRSRTNEIASYNPGISSDSAHNIPLDIGSNGGVPLLLIYFAIIFYVLISIVRMMRRSNEFNPYFASIVAAWVAYEVQSLISINQLGLGIWGWSLSGLIIGYELNTRTDSLVKPNKTTNKEIISSQKISFHSFALIIAITVTGIAISVPPYLAATKFYSALQSGDANIIEHAAYLKPYDRARFSYVAQILQENKLESRAIVVLRDATNIYPDSIELWRRWSSIPSAKPAEISQAREEIKRLDPFNPDLK